MCITVERELDSVCSIYEQLSSLSDIITDESGDHGVS